MHLVLHECSINNRDGISPIPVKTSVSAARVRGSPLEEATFNMFNARIATQKPNRLQQNHHNTNRPQDEPRLLHNPTTDGIKNVCWCVSLQRRRHMVARPLGEYYALTPRVARFCLKVGTMGRPRRYSNVARPPASSCGD